MSLAGRCECGLLLELVADDPEPHLICRGEKRCRTCGEVRDRTRDFRKGGRGGINGTCRACERPVIAAHKRARYHSDSAFRARTIWYGKQYKALGPLTGRRKPQIQKPQPLFRTCKACAETKPIADFYEPSKRRRRGRCYPCYRKRENEIRRERRRNDTGYRLKARLEKRLSRARLKSRAA